MEALAADPDVWERSFEHVRVGLALADLDGVLVRANTEYAVLLGRSTEDLVGVPLLEVLHHDDRPAAADRLGEVLAGLVDSVSAEQRQLRPDGQVVWVQQVLSAVHGPDGRATWLAVSAQDVTERRAAEDRLREMAARLAEQAVRDPLTGLANRTVFEERLRAALARDARTGGTTGVLFLDLDGFKEVNDRHGHALGDAVLRVVGRRLLDCVRPSDTVARLGGDEFVVLVDSTSADGLSSLVDRLVTAVAEPVDSAGLTLEVGVSVGAAVSVAGEAGAEGLLAAADQAMYVAKRAGSTSARG